MRTLVFMFCLISSTNSFSQEPFGKRFMVSMKQGFSLVDYISTDFIGHNRLSINCVFGKNFMIGVDGNYSYAKYNKYKTDPNYSSGNIWENAPQIRDMSVGASLYYFRNKEGGYAPTGRYFFISTSYGVANVQRYEKVQTGGNQWNPYYSYYNTLDKDSTRTSIILGIGFGRNFIIKKRLLLGYSLDFGFDMKATQARWENRYIMRPSIQIGYTF